jgi:hypothetical protein
LLIVVVCCYKIAFKHHDHVPADAIRSIQMARIFGLFSNYHDHVSADATLAVAHLVIIDIRWCHRQTSLEQ